MRTYGLRAGFCLLIAVLVLPASGAAQVFESVGVRALGMGGAFVAVADDATATYWNPAGLATGALFSLVFDRQMLDVIPDAARRAGRDAGALGGTGSALALGTVPLGLSHYRVRTSEVGPAATASPGVSSEDDQGIRPLALGSLVTHQSGLTILQSVAAGVTVAGTVKVVRGLAHREVRETATPVADLIDEIADLVGRASTAVDFDFGVMAEAGRLRAGLVARNLREPAFEAPDAARLRLQRQVRAGAALARGSLIVAADLDLTRTATPVGPRRMLAVGAERAWARRVAFRGGLRVNTAADRRPAAAIGASYAAAGPLWVDAQLTRGARGADRGWGLGARIAF